MLLTPSVFFSKIVHSELFMHTNDKDKKRRTEQMTQFSVEMC